ncbi:MAG: PhzF family phenazine biosynthesis protein [Streptosporangiales bacterium]
MPETLYVLKVFVGADGFGGNPLGVFLGAAGWPPSRRQEIATDLGFSETVFVGDAGEVRIHTPAVELPLAGHPLVGTAWLLAHMGHAVRTLRPPAGEVPTWEQEGRTWISARPEWAPEGDTHQLSSAAEVEAHPGAGPDELLHVWAWQDEPAGQVRVRMFPTAMGIVEDEATGSAALRLGALLSRPLTIHQGVASQILVRPGDDGTVAVGGRVELVETRPY